MKLAVTGKGGVGKTTMAALLAYALRDRGQKVIAIDADPDSNLLACMGHPAPETVRPLVGLKDLIEERTGVKPGTVGGVFRLNPEVGDIPAKYAVEVDGIRVLVAGAVKKGGSGCYCPENALVRTLIAHVLLDPATALVLDMEAGVEHLSRGTVGAVDTLVVVVEPGRRSVETALRIAKMAGEIGLKRVRAVGNKIRADSERAWLRKALSGLQFAGFVRYEESLRAAEVSGRPLAGASAGAEKAVKRIVAELESKNRA